MSITLLVLFLFILISLPTLIAYLFYRSVRKKNKILGIIPLIICPLFTVFVIYRAFYPSDNFFLEEYKTVTLKSAPNSAVVVRKSATYPDFHGDYISVAMIKLAKQDYSKLLKDVFKDKQMDAHSSLVGSVQLNDVVRENENLIKYTFTRDLENYYASISFLNDNKTVIIQIISF